QAAKISPSAARWLSGIWMKRQGRRPPWSGAVRAAWTMVRSSASVGPGAFRRLAETETRVRSPSSSCMAFDTNGDGFIGRGARDGIAVFKRDERVGFGVIGDATAARHVIGHDHEPVGAIDGGIGP